MRRNRMDLGQRISHHVAKRDGLAVSWGYANIAVSTYTASKTVSISETTPGSSGGRFSFRSFSGYFEPL
jgi:hypothetical protein